MRTYGSKELDASLLLLPAIGFLPPRDPRIVGTVAASRPTRATRHRTTLRYRRFRKTDYLRAKVCSSALQFLACGRRNWMLGRGDDALNFVRADVVALQRRWIAERGSTSPIAPTGGQFPASLFASRARQHGQQPLPFPEAGRSVPSTGHRGQKPGTREHFHVIARELESVASRSIVSGACARILAPAGRPYRACEADDGRGSRLWKSLHFRTQRRLRKAVIASTIGTTIEWYDFFIYGTAAGLCLASSTFRTKTRHRDAGGFRHLLYRLHRGDRLAAARFGHTTGTASDARQH